MRPRNAIILHRHPLYRRALCETLNSLPLLCREYDSLNEIFKDRFNVITPALVMLDLWLSGINEISSHNYLRIRCLRSRFPYSPIVAVSDIADDVFEERCLALGLSGYVSQTAEALVITDKVRQLLASEPGSHPGGSETSDTLRAPRIANLLQEVTARECLVLMLLCDGLTNSQIGEQLEITEQTVKAYVSKILRKLGALNRIGAIVSLQHAARTAISPRPCIDDVTNEFRQLIGGPV